MLNGIWWLVVYAAIFACIPAIHPLPNHGIKGQFSFLKSGNVRLILLTILFGCSGIFCWFSYVSPQMIYKVGFQQQDMTRIMFIAGLGMTIGNLLGGKLGDLWGPARLIKYTQLCVALVLVLIFLPLNFKWASVLLMFIATAGFFMLPSSQQVLLLRNSKGCEMMGAASLQIVFNMGNAIGAYIGGILVEMGWGYQYPALFGATLVIASWFFISIFIHRMGRNNT